MRRKHLAPFLIAAGLLLIACGAPASSPGSSAKSGTSSSEAPYSPLTYTGSDRMQKLEAEAKKEGKVTWYTVLAGEVVAALAEGFKKDYGIEVSVFRTDETPLLTRAVQEDAAGRNVADVLEMGSQGFLQVEDLGLIQPYYSPLAKTLPTDLVVHAPGDLVLGVNDRAIFIGFAYNKNMISADAVPEKIEDLLNPALKGKISVTNTSTTARWVGMVLKVLGDAKGREFLSKLSAQQMSVQSVSAAALMDLIAAGQVGASPTIFLDHTRQQEKKGAAVGWVALDNRAVTNLGMVMIGKKAPNPNAAMLFGEYIVAGNGVNILKQLNYSPGTEKQPFDLFVPEAGMTGRQYEAATAMWQGLADQTFRR